MVHCWILTEEPKNEAAIGKAMIMPSYMFTAQQVFGALLQRFSQPLQQLLQE